MPSKKMAPSNAAQLQLVYDGPEVKDGTLSVEDMIDALTGFGRAYDKIADFQSVPFKHHLRVTGIRRASADILISVTSQVDPNATLNSVAQIAQSVAGILVSIIGFIEFKRHTKGSRPLEVNVIGNNGTVNVINAEKSVMSLSKRDFDLYSSGLLDSDLDHLTRPLREGCVDAVEFRDAGGKSIDGSRITAKEREYFSHSGEDVTTTKNDVTLEGEMKSLNKDSNSGLFHLSNGKRVRYKLAGKNPQVFWRAFAYSGPVKVRCRVHLDGELNPTLLDIFDVERLQRHLFQPSPTAPKRLSNKPTGQDGEAE